MAKRDSESGVPFPPSGADRENLNRLRAAHAEKFLEPDAAFSRIRPGSRIFVATACGEPTYLVDELVRFVAGNPKAFFDAEVMQVLTLGVAPFANERYRGNFRVNSFFIGQPIREAVNAGGADYEPVFLSRLPRFMRTGLVPIDVAVIQTSLPDRHGHLSLGVSVDIVRAAVETADFVIAQVNAHMPRVHGETFLSIDDIDALILRDEPIIEIDLPPEDETRRRIGNFVAGLVMDGDTLQVGYGVLPNAVLASLAGKHELGIHTELLTDGLANLMRAGAVTNRKKTLNRGKAVAAFCMGTRDTYAFLHDNPAFEFRPVDYTNDPLVIARQERMCAINTALSIDLTGQSTSESLGRQFFSGIGGHADFMRGALLAPGGKAILALPSTAAGGTVSRIVPFLDEGAGVTLTRGDVQYVVTEYGVAHLFGKNVRERAMSLIAIAHPKFREELLEKAKAEGLVYKDQAFVPGRRGEYPEHLESTATTKTGLTLRLRPVRISDEPILKEFFYALSDKSVYRRFISARRDMPHERLQEFAVIDYTREMVILAFASGDDAEELVGVGQWSIDEARHVAEVAFVVRDEYQGRGIGYELLKTLTRLARKQGLLGFTAEVLAENHPMLRVFEKMGFDTTRRRAAGVVELVMRFPS